MDGSALSVVDKSKLVQRLVQGVYARMNGAKDVNRSLKQANTKFMSATAAIRLISDGHTVLFEGFGVHDAPLRLFHALKTRFEQIKHPRNLTAIIIASGHTFVVAGMCALLSLL